jgi:hypothetical protein
MVLDCVGEQRAGRRLCVIVVLSGNGAQLFLSFGILFDCAASSFLYDDYNCTIIGSFAFCNASSSSVNYSCDGIGSIVFCTTSDLNAPNYDCTVVAALVSCTTSSLNDPNFSCLGASTSYSLYLGPRS